MFQFHNKLNPALWRQGKLIPIVRLKLFQTALSFYKFLDVGSLIVSDIIVTGSNAAFNYTKLSDIDVHLIVDLAHSACPHMADNLFLTKKALWAQTYDVKIHDFPIELYVEDVSDPVKANGVFSIIHNEWIRQPSPVKPTADATDVRQKRDAYAAMIDDMLSGQPNLKDINELLQKLHVLRQNGLDSKGEFSVENLAYKALRDSGLLQDLVNKRTEVRTKELSL